MSLKLVCFGDKKEGKMIFKKQNKISAVAFCKACSETGKIEKLRDFKTGGSLTTKELEIVLKSFQGICLACNGLGFQIVEKFVEGEK